MGVDSVIPIRRGSDFVCDVFFECRPQNYNRFLKILQSLSIKGETVLELENIFILQTREAVDYAYKTGLCEMIAIRNVDHFDHILTTQATKTPQESHEK